MTIIRFRRGASLLAISIYRLAAIQFLSFLLLGSALVVADARAKTPPAKPEVRLDEIGRGELLFRGDGAGVYHPAPQLGTDVTMAVAGMVNRVTVRQKFENSEDSWVEGIYVFPLPENAAVDHLRMQIGERFINGEIRERSQARREYEAAKAEGKTASLLEQDRPNIFTTSVANIGPGEEIIIEIEYQQTLTYDSGRFSLRFPMVVGPRYIPGEIRVAGFGGAGWAANTNRVPDAARITPPVLHPAFGKINPVTMEIVIDAGFTLDEVVSATHGIATQKLPGDRVAVTLDDGDVPADRDFGFSWTPSVGNSPGAGLFVENRPDGKYLLLMLMPPQGAATDSASPPREVVFVIDTSGSMAGPSLEQAKTALAMALDRLGPEDRFNIIQFNSYTSSLFPEAMAAAPRSVIRAKRYVAHLEANGGTEMLPALEAAFGDKPGDGRIRQVVFLTDGAIGNEAELFAAIQQRLSDRRLFTIGIGSAPNSYFMRKAAEFGRGTFTYIDDVSEVESRMAALFVKLEQPVVTDIDIAWPDGIAAETMPATIPDLYRGEPVVLSARLDRLEGALAMRGRRGREKWILTVPLDSGADHPGIGALWARDKIEELSDTLHRGASEDTVRAGITDVALAHHLVSRYTSLVAIDITPRRPIGENTVSRNLPTNLPAGWDFDKVFGSPAERRAGNVPILQRASLDVPGEAEQEALMSVPLPQTATDAELRLLAGLVALMLAALLWRRARRAA